MEAGKSTLSSNLQSGDTQPNWDAQGYISETGVWLCTVAVPCGAHFLHKIRSLGQRQLLPYTIQLPRSTVAAVTGIPKQGNKDLPRPPIDSFRIATRRHASE